MIIHFGHISKSYIYWQFIRSNSSQFGGISEAAMKSVKIHLKRATANNNGIRRVFHFAYPINNSSYPVIQRSQRH